MGIVRASHYSCNNAIRSRRHFRNTISFCRTASGNRPRSSPSSADDTRAEAVTVQRSAIRTRSAGARPAGGSKGGQCLPRQTLMWTHWVGWLLTSNSQEPVVSMRRCRASTPSREGLLQTGATPRGGDGGVWRCCMNRHWLARCPPTGFLPADAIRRWLAEGGHPIQDLTAEDDLTPLPSWAPGAKAISNDGRVAEERVLHPALTMVP